MEKFLTEYCPQMIAVIAFLELVLLILFLRDYKKTKNIMILCMAAITLGLFFDAFIIDIGSVFTAPAVLKVISRIRFISHGALIPLLFPICAYSLKVSDKTKRVVWVFTAILSAAGLASALASDLVAIDFAGVTRYMSSESTPAWADGITMALSFGTVIPLVITGIVVWVKQKTPFMFLSGLLMFIFAGAGPSIGDGELTFFITMFGEVFMAGFMYLYERREQKIKNSLI